METEYHLFTPGPTPIPEDVRKRLTDQIIYHRSDEFKEIFKRVKLNLQYIFQTSHPVLTLTCSGTGGMEASFTNLFSPDDTIICVNNGKFSARWVDMAKAFGLNVVEIKIDWGDAPNPEQILSILKKYPDAKAVYLVHCETSTGTMSDVRSLSNVIRNNSSALICVDGVSSIGALEFRFDEWGIDLCVTASQKGLMIPPGLALISLSQRAIDAIKFSKLPKYYFDFRKILDAYYNEQTPWTPAISLIVGLDESLKKIKNEGIEKVWQRHEVLGELIREGVRILGLSILSRYPSNSVTAVLLPTNINSQIFTDILREKYRCIVGRGQEQFSKKLFRIAHMGNIKINDAFTILSAIEGALNKLGYRSEVGRVKRLIDEKMANIQQY